MLYGWESLARPDQSLLAVPFRACGNPLRCPPVAAHTLRVRVAFRRSVTVDAAADNRLTIVLCLGVTSPRFSVFEAFSARGDGAISFPLVAFVSVFSCSFFGFRSILFFQFILPVYSASLFFQFILPVYSSSLFCQFILPVYSASLFFQFILPVYSSSLFFPFYSSSFLSTLPSVPTPLRWNIPSTTTTTLRD